MKKVTLFILFLGTVSAYAQSFKLYEVADDAAGNEIADGTTLTDTCGAYNGEVLGGLSVFLENATGVDKTVVCEREITQKIEGAEIDFCWGSCVRDVSILEMLVEANTKREMETHYTAPIVVGLSIARYVFYGKDNREDSISVTFEYLTLPGTSVPLIVVNNSFSVYPNPANYELRITNYELKEGDVIEIYDVMGQMVYQITKSTNNQINNTTIDISHLASGMYYLRIGNRAVKFAKE